MAILLRQRCGPVLRSCGCTHVDNIWGGRGGRAVSIKGGGPAVAQLPNLKGSSLTSTMVIQTGLVETGSCRTDFMTVPVRVTKLDGYCTPPPRKLADIQVVFGQPEKPRATLDVYSNYQEGTGRMVTTWELSRPTGQLTRNDVDVSLTIYLTFSRS